MFDRDFAHPARETRQGDLFFAFAIYHRYLLLVVTMTCQIVDYFLGYRL